ncbi:hypothetical protein [Xenophilus azovorans]|uniref:hypothetical protein n=1 Tax=Xenophilus azovorans TaxID=151755 RepID=UPI00056F18A6|nr:hypothetical protein [Xenophilus azovorans]
MRARLLSRWFAAALCALLLAACAAPAGKDAASSDAPPGCPADARALPVEALYGRWLARFDGAADAASVALHAHPEYAGSVRGSVTRGGPASPHTSQLAGDVTDDGILALDESRDGRSISAVWTAELVPASCGKEFKGTWRNAADDRTLSFVLTRASPPSP